MAFLRLLLKNVLRNRRRSFLTVTSIAVSLFLVATLRTVITELENPPSTPESALRLISRHKVSLINVLPMAYREKIASLEGVKGVVGSMWFGGVYKDPSNFFAQFAVTTDQFFDVYGDIDIPAEQKEAFLQDKTGAIVDTLLVRRFGWKIGDRVHLKGTIFNFDPELTIRGVFESPTWQNVLFFHLDYLHDGVNNRGFVGTYAIKAGSAELVPVLAERVDALFQNSPVPTKTESEKAFVLSFVDMMGNVQFLINSICSVVIFTIILVAANTMAMSIRERTREIGILKALGFRSRQVLNLLLAESVFLSLVGALLGAGGARFLYSGIDLGAMTMGFLQRFYVTPGTLLLCALIGLGVGILAAGFPAWQASRRSVVEALRGVV